MEVDLTTLKNQIKEDSNQKWTKEQEELLASWSERQLVTDGYSRSENYMIVVIIHSQSPLLFSVL